MKITIIKSEQRGESNIEWLHSRFSFSFAGYYNPQRMGFGALRVLNDDIIQPGRGFGEHPHADMEIISIPTYGVLAHKDSTGVEEEILPGEIQVMSAGSGITHSEYNHLQDQEGRFFQIWIHPDKKGIPPRHAKKKIEYIDNAFCVVASSEEKDGSIQIQQNAKLSIGKFSQDTTLDYTVTNNRGLFVFVIEGEVGIGEHKLFKRDAAEIRQTELVSLVIRNESHVLLIEVPMSI